MCDLWCEDIVHERWGTLVLGLRMSNIVECACTNGVKVLLCDSEEFKCQVQC